MSESGTENKGQALEHTSSRPEGGPSQRENSLPAKDSSGDKAPAAATGKGNDSERQARIDRPPGKPAATDGAAGARPGGRDGHLGPAPRTREEPNTKADVNPVPKPADGATPVGSPGAGTAADKSNIGSVADGIKKAVSGQDSPLRIGAEKLQRAGEAVVAGAREVREADRAAYKDIGEKATASAGELKTAIKQAAESETGRAVLGWNKGAAGVVWEATPGPGIVNDVKDIKTATSAPQKIGEIAERRARAVDGAVIGGSTREGLITFAQEKAKGSTTGDAAVAGLDEGMKHVPFAGSAEKLDQTLTAFRRGDTEGGFKALAGLVGGFSKEVLEKTSILAGALGEAPRPSTPHAPEAPKTEGPKVEAPKAVDPLAKTQDAPKAVDPLGKTQEAPKAVDPLAKTQEAPKAVDPLAKTQEAPKTGDAGAAGGPIHGQVRGGPEVGPQGAVTERTPATPTTADQVAPTQPAPEARPETGPPTIRGLGPDGPSATPAKMPGTGEMSGAKFDANLKEMKQLERSGKAYDAKGNPTPAYAEVLRKFEGHVEARSAGAAGGRAQAEPDKSPMARSQAPDVKPDAGGNAVRPEGGAVATPAKMPGTGEMSGAKFDANLKEMKQLERSGKAYDAKGNPTPAYAEVLRKFEGHVEARSAGAAGGRAQAEPDKSPMAESVRTPANAGDALARTQQAPNAGDAGAARGPIHAEVRGGGREVAAKSPMAESVRAPGHAVDVAAPTQRTANAGDAGAARGPIHAEVRGGGREVAAKSPMAESVRAPGHAVDVAAPTQRAANAGDAGAARGPIHAEVRGGGREDRRDRADFQTMEGRPGDDRRDRADFQTMEGRPGDDRRDRADFQTMEGRPGDDARFSVTRETVDPDPGFSVKLETADLDPGFSIKLETADLDPGFSITPETVHPDPGIEQSGPSHEQRDVLGPNGRDRPQLGKR